MSHDDVVGARRVLERHGIPDLGDIHLATVGGEVQVRVEVNGEWRVAITASLEFYGTISHHVDVSGTNPLDWELTSEARALRALRRGERDHGRLQRGEITPEGLAEELEERPN